MLPIRSSITLLLAAAGLLLSACAGLLLPTEPGVSPYATRVQSGGFEASEATTGLMAALREAGAAVRWAGTVNQPFLTVPGWLLRVNGQEVQAFEYRDEAARVADMDRLAILGVPDDIWAGEQRLWAVDSLVVLYMGEQPEIAALLTGALGQPSPVLLTSEVPPTPLFSPTPTATPTPTPTITPTPTPVTPLPPDAFPVLGTNVERVEAVRNIPIYGGPGDVFPVMGEIRAGNRTQVTGISADGNWWRVLCPDGTVGNCWVSGGAKATRPIF